MHIVIGKVSLILGYCAGWSNNLFWDVMNQVLFTWWCAQGMSKVNILRPKPNGRSFADDSFKRIFLNENVWISLKISLKFVPKGPINNIPALVWIMAWRRPGDKPLSEPMMVSLPTHICVTRPQWVNLGQLNSLWRSCRSLSSMMVSWWPDGPGDHCGVESTFQRGRNSITLIICLVKMNRIPWGFPVMKYT